jgi:hypothetical protein
MLSFGVTILATVPQMSEIPEGLMNYLVYFYIMFDLQLSMCFFVIGNLYITLIFTQKLCASTRCRSLQAYPQNYSEYNAIIYSKKVKYNLNTTNDFHKGNFLTLWRFIISAEKECVKIFYFRSLTRPKTSYIHSPVHPKNNTQHSYENT